MSSEAEPARYAVVGNPVAHSQSPRIHAEFARQTGQALSYEAIELPRDGFETGVRDLQRRGYAGLNVTVPFKQDAWRICERLSERAELAGAVNTLVLERDGSISGDNTDGVGLSRDLSVNLGFEIKQRRLLILGAGGAVRGVLGPLLGLEPESLTIANRTPEKAETLARDFADLGRVDARAFDQLGQRPYDLIINGTAAGLSGEVPPIAADLVGAETCCYDMMYRLDAPTAFVEWSFNHGAGRASDGLGMLVEQAAEAFRVWRGVEADGAAVIALLRDG